MTGDDLISLAGNLAVNAKLGNGEARYRSAASRAYYGAFHLASAFLRDLGARVPRNHLGHDEAFKLLANCGEPDANGAAALLHELRSIRNRADYRLDDDRFQTPEQSIRSVEAARDFQACLVRCRTDAARATIVQGIEAYRAKINRRSDQ